MNNLILDFEQAKSKHLLFKSRLRSILYDIAVDEAPVLSHYECSVGQWIYNHALAEYGHIPEMLELEKVHADIHISARKLVALHKEGKTREARNGLSEMEVVADELVGLLTIIEQKLTSEPEKLSASENLDFKFEEYHDLLRSNDELDKRIQQQIIENNESNLKYEAVLAALHEGIIIQDAHGVVQSSNHSAQLLLGLSADQIRGRTPMYEGWKAIHEDGTTMPGEEQAPMLALKTGYPELNQLMGVRRGDDTLVWLRVNAQPLINRDNNEITGVVSSFFDVTEARISAQELQKSYVEQQVLNEELAAANEEHSAINEELTSTNADLVQMQFKLQDLVVELGESEERFRNLVLLAPVGICMIKGDPFQVAVINDNFLEIIGRKREDFDHQSYWGAIPEIAPIYEPITKDVIATGKTYYANGHEIRLIRHGIEETIYVDFVYEPIRNLDGTMDTILIVANEVTQQVLERKKTERAEETLRLAIDAAQLGSWHIEPVTKALEYNTTLAKIFGYKGTEPMTFDQAIGQVTEEYRDKIIEEIEKAIHTGGDYDITYAQRRFDDNEVIWLRSTGKVSADNKGEYTIFSGVVMDITEQRLDELRKNDFIAMVSHELKTPLTSLMAIVQLASVKLKDNKDKFLGGAMEKATAQVKKMTHMINGFLNISRLESGKLLIDKQQFNFNEVLLEIIDETRLTANTHSLVFEPCADVIINADKNKIGSVVSNLLSNAAKYSPKGTSITIKCLPTDNKVTVSVTDEGFGIKPDDAAHLFNRYYRVEDVNTRHISGFGIGLYLSAEIINRHNGRIWVESEVGKGSTFYFSLPLG